MERLPDPDHAGRHIYELTPAGRDLWPVLHSLLVWGGRHRHPNSRVFKHAACGRKLDDRGACPKCGATPGPEDVLMEPRRNWGTLRDDRVTLALRETHRLLEPVET